MMSTIKIYFLTMLFIQTISISAQSVISGRITEKDGFPMVGATIVLLNQADSAYIAGTTSDLDGRFEVINIKPGHYILSLSTIGYKKIKMPLQTGLNANIELGDILFEKDTYMLSTINVTGKRPPVKVTPGK